jgi:hypothetical protein
MTSSPAGVSRCSPVSSLRYPERKIEGEGAERKLAGSRSETLQLFFRAARALRWASIAELTRGSA